MTDEDGYIVWLAMIEPFGKTAVHPVSEIENNFRFPGQYYDAETGLHYNYHRYYNPDTGRYLTPDPLGLAAGQNIFTYTDNNPVNNSDLLGMIAKEAVGLFCTSSVGECINDCLRDTYGNLFDVAETLNPLAPLSIVLNEVSGELIKNANRIGNMNKYKGPTNFDLGKRQHITMSQFNTFNNIMAGVGSFALGFEIGAVAYCSFICSD